MFNEIIEYIKNSKTIQRRVTVKSLVVNFQKQPYGWKDFDIRAIIAKLWVEGTISILIHNTQVAKNNANFKMDFTRKARYCAGGHTTDAPDGITYSSVVSRDSVRIGFLAAALHGVDVLAIDLENENVAAVSLWLGPQRTERTEIVLRHRGEQYDDFMAVAETPEFNGHIIHALAADGALMEKSGQTLVTAELAPEYNITDTGGNQPPSYRDQLGEPRIPHPARVI